MKVFVILFLTLLVLQLFDLSSGHWWRKRKSKSKPRNGFKGLMCRLRHYKTILNDDNKIVGCKRKCPTNYKEGYSLHWGHHCKPIVIPTGCADEFCVHCIPGYKWMYTYPFYDRCVEDCPSGYMVTSSNMCEVCTIEDCDRCKDQWACEKCNAGFSLYSNFMDSVICVQRCPSGYVKVNQNGVQSCVRRQIKTTSMPETTTTTTSTTTTTTATDTTKNTTPKKTITNALPQGCKDANCINCETGYFKFYPQTRGSYCLTQCPVGYSALGSLCVACADRRCASCKASLSECDKCFKGYSMLLDAFNITVECVRTCPVGYKQDIVGGVKYCVKTPQPACSISKCKSCVRSDLHALHSGCEECSEGFSLFRGSFNDHCYQTCPPGFYSSVKPGTNITACAKCSTVFCNKCTEDDVCTECFEPLVLNKSLKRCTTCPAKQQYNFEFKECAATDSNRPENVFEGVNQK